MSITYSLFQKPRMSCRRQCAWRCFCDHFTFLQLTSFAPSPPGALKFMAGRKPTDGKQLWSWLTLEALAVSEEAGVEGVGVGSLWELMLLPMNFEELEPPDAWCCWLCSWSCFVLRNRPPDPRARFMAWRCRDSWRYGCEERNFCNLYLHVNYIPVNNKYCLYRLKCRTDSCNFYIRKEQAKKWRRSLRNAYC